MKTTSIFVLATFLVVALFVPATTSATDCWQDVADCLEAVGRLLDRCDGMTGSAAD